MAAYRSEPQLVQKISRSSVALIYACLGHLRAKASSVSQGVEKKPCGQSFPTVPEMHHTIHNNTPYT